ncbi:putative toxin-antitoxin system toxin component, PIN family [Rhodanobacter sp. BL-MT-08]
MTADHPVAPSVPRIVLDTNVCLDLFLFNDPHCAHLMLALRNGSVQAVTRDDCRDEWRRVLHYPQVPIDDATRPAVSAAFDGLIHYLDAEESTVADDAWLPRCADPDDQKFLELALASGARWLISKDKELLKLDWRSRAAGLFPILLPQQWSRAMV